ncbi:MAG TPA: NrpR regulatory domain-containing protein [Thermodesulfovibrionales bacterium]|nr:NrpR regulatory domain-containing protein [Thermodesulfovibrionales bacterium]
MNKTMLSILKVLDKKPDTIIGSREISKRLTTHGVDLTERTVRYHLRILDERGFTKVYGKEGRKITAKGRDELGKSLVSEKVGFVINKIETLAFMTDFDLSEKKGNVILNVSFFRENTLAKVLKIMKDVFMTRYCMSDRVVLSKAGDIIGDIVVPEGYAGFGTVCSVTINGIFLKAGIPVASKFGGVLQIEEGNPSRFVALISYEGSSLDPLEIFIKSNMTDISGAIKYNSGKILASFRELPLVCLERAKEMNERMIEEGIGGILALGNPNQPLLQMPVGVDKAGMVVVGGLNPVAAVEEAGIPTQSSAMSTLFEYSDLVRFRDLL